MFNRERVILIIESKATLWYRRVVPDGSMVLWPAVRGPRHPAASLVELAQLRQQVVAPARIVFLLGVGECASDLDRASQ